MSHYIYRPAKAQYVPTALTLLAVWAELIERGREDLRPEFNALVADLVIASAIRLRRYPSSATVH